MTAAPPGRTGPDVSRTGPLGTASKGTKGWPARAEYDGYADGKPRADGTRSFLQARGISLQEGQPDDPPGTESVNGPGNWKNQIVLRLLAEGGISAYPGSARYLRQVREAGLRCAVVSASANAHAVLAAAGLASFPEVVIDGVVDRASQAQALRAHGADVVVKDLADLLAEP